MIKIILSILLLFSFQTQASSANNKLSRRPSSISDFTLQISFGDKLSAFRVWEDTSGRFYSFSTNYGRVKKGNLSGKNYTFLIQQANLIRDIQSNDRSLCSTSFISLTSRETEKTGCIGSKTPIAGALTDLANTLNLLL